MAPRELSNFADDYVHTPGERGFWATTQPLLVTEGLTELMVLMAHEHPSVKLRAEDLSSPNGFLLFQEPVAAEVFGFPDERLLGQPVRAISWQAQFWWNDPDGEKRTQLATGKGWGSFISKAECREAEGSLLAVLWCEGLKNAAPTKEPLSPAMFMRIPCSFSDTVKSATWF